MARASLSTSSAMISSGRWAPVTTFSRMGSREDRLRYGIERYGLIRQYEQAVRVDQAVQIAVQVAVQVLEGPSGRLPQHRDHYHDWI